MPDATPPLLPRIMFERLRDSELAERLLVDRIMSFDETPLVGATSGWSWEITAGVCR
ncbi:MAG: hypothetical protein H8K04_13675 [Nitrospira sp.]